MPLDLCYSGYHLFSDFLSDHSSDLRLSELNSTLRPGGGGGGGEKPNTKIAPSNPTAPQNSKPITSTKTQNGDKEVSYKIELYSPPFTAIPFPLYIASGCQIHVHHHPQLYLRGRFLFSLQRRSKEPVYRVPIPGL